MSKMELILLGRFECLLPSGTRISLSMRKAEVLLAYLALTPGLRHPRERLINLLWSDRGEEQARNSLRQCLSAIKKSLGEVADLVLQVDRTSVSLIPELIDIDLHEFERLAAEGGYESLTTAADLYQGEFLEGISIRDAACQEWLDGERSRFKRQFIEILGRLAETQLLSHDYGHAIKSAERLVKQDPLGESGWRLLMRAYFDNGDRSHALQAFKRCQQALRNELDVDPEAATIELRDRIAGGEANPEPAPTAIASKPAVDSPASSDHSIAVLPFDNLSGDPEQEYFSDGITDSIILNLSLFPGLQVKSRNSSFAFKQQIKSLGEISTELNVDYIVEGSIRKSDQHIRITVQLVDAAEGNQIWGKRYDADLTDLFTLEEELSRSIAATVTGQIESELQRIAIAKGAADQQSYDLLLSGIYHNQRYNRQDTVIAIEKLSQCLAKDPDNVRALMWIYVSHLMAYLGRWTQDYLASFKLAAENIQKAMVLAPESCMVQVFYAQYLVFCGEFEKATKRLDKAFEINPNDPTTLTTMALNLEIQGKAEDALRFAERACLLDPYHPWAEWELAVSQFICGQHETTLTTITKMRTSPGFIQIFGIASNVKLGRIDQARQALQSFLRESRESMLAMPQTIDEWLQYTRENYPFADPQINRDIIECLIQAGLSDEVSFPDPRIQSSGHGIAVLPFDNLSGDPEQEYFSDGITESIILNLSVFAGLNVKSRNSSFAFKQQLKSIGEITSELDVDYVVEGSIRKTDERIRVTVQLVEAISGNQVWGKRYDAEIENLFDLEEELSRTIAATITGQIESDLQRISLAKGAAHQQAYDLLLQGTYFLHLCTAEDTARAIVCLDRCLDSDPDNLRAHVILYCCHILNWMERWLEDYEPSFELAGKHAAKAVALDPESGMANYAIGEFMMFSRDYEKADKYFDKALSINPSDPNALTAKAVNLQMQGNLDTAYSLAQKAYQLDPHNWWADWNLAEAQYLNEHYRDAIETIENSKNAPGFIQVYAIASHVKLGNLDIARRLLQEFLSERRNSMAAFPATNEDWLRYTTDTAPFVDQGINQGIVDCLLQAGLDEELASASFPNDKGDQPSILVLPFSNLSGDPEQQYFSDGITSSLILSLGLYNGLAVKSQNSSFAYKDSGKSSEQIAEELNANYLVEGSIRKSASNIRISVQLIESANGNQVWGQQYDSKLEDVLDLEQELSQTIAATISGRIGHKLQQSAARKPAKDLQSYDYLMRGLYHLGKFSANDLEIAKKEFGKCLEIDPDNTSAHFGLGEVYFVEALEGWTKDRQKSEELAARHLETSLRLEPDNALAHAYMADYLNWVGDYGQSEFHADKAIELNPTAAEGYFVKADVLRFTRRIEQAIPYADKSLQLDPHSVGAGWAAGGVYQAAGQYDKAIKTFRSISHPPASIYAQIAACFIGLGLPEEARKEMKRYQQLARQQMSNYPESEGAWRLVWREYSSVQHDEDFEELFDLLKQAGLCEDLIGAVDDMPSIAVLPFENMSGDPEQEHFSDGITADIISTLSKFGHLRTISRYSTQQYKTQKLPIADIAQQQNARYILEGSVRKSGDRIRVNAELIDSVDGQICWNERYDRDLDDLFAVQDEITRHIALAMKVQLDDGDMALHRSKGATDIKAWELVMAAVDLMDTYIRQNIVEARAMANKAIKLDPAYAYAWVALAWTYWQEAYSGWSESVGSLIDEAENANRRAMQLDPDYGEVWSQAGMNHIMRHEPEQAIEACSKAVELEPGNAEVQALAAFACIFNGDYEQGHSHYQNVLKLCPIRPNWYYLIGAQLEKIAGNLDRAAEISQQGIDVEPDSPLCRFYLIDVMCDKGDQTGAHRLADEVRALDKEVTGRGLVQAYSYDRALRDRFQANLAQFDLL